ncbi:hypothetical protein VTL71DRAFT_16566 [Oculimacula yallundae]|uniref:Ubiquitin-like domain-containing protein n=1 Tax=Oculimacula yallundae TaxID=86028 RepID=A0ABR4CH17_9HELO
MSFGFSAGDFVASLLLVKDVVKALDASTGSIAEVKALLTTLESLQNALIVSLGVYGRSGPAILNDGADSLTQTIVVSIESEWKECSKILDTFMKSLKPYQDSFCNNQGSTLVRHARKLTWLLRKDDVLQVDKKLTWHLKALEMYCKMLSHLHSESIMQTSATILSNVVDIRASITSISQAIQPLKSIPPTLGYAWESSSSLSDHVTLLDAIGRSVILPLILISSPEDIHRLLVIMYRDIPGRNKILKQEYAFTDEEFEGMILESYNWATRIRAGMKLSLNIIFPAAQSFDVYRCPRCKVVCSGSKLPGRRRQCQTCQLTFQVFDKPRSIQDVSDIAPGEMSEQKTKNDSSPPSLGSASGLVVKGKDTESLFKNIHYHREIPGAQYSPGKSTKQLLIDDLPPLHKAAALGNASVIRRLLDEGSEIDFPLPFDAILASPSCSSLVWNPHKFGGCTALHIACWFGKLNAITALLDRGANILAQAHPHGYEVLTFALQGHNPEQVFYPLLEHGARVQYQDVVGHSPLSIASATGKSFLIHELLRRDAVVNTTDNYGNTPLQVATYSGHETAFDILLSLGASLTADNKVPSIEDNRRPILHHAAQGGSVYIIQSLLDLGEDPNTVDFWGCLALREAIWNGQIEARKLLLGNTTIINTTSSLASQILRQASWAGLDELVVLLLQKGADCNHKDPFRQTSLHYACGNFLGKCSRATESTVRLLLEAGAGIEHNGWEGGTPLHYAAGSGLLGIVKLLLDRSANISAVDMNGSTPLHWAGNIGHTAIADLLLKYGADVNARSEDGITPLHSAAWNGAKTVADLLLKYGADVNARSEDGITPLHSAAWNGAKAVADLLLKHGADVNARSGEGETPLSCALGWGHLELADMLLNRANADAKISERDSTTSLHRASSRGFTQIVRLLLDLGLEIEAVHTLGRTALHTAARWKEFNSADCLPMLLKHGANINATAPVGCKSYNKDQEPQVEVAGCTPLICASEQGYLAAVKILLDAGADITASRVDGKNALSCAVGSGNAEIVALLLEKGIDTELPDLNGRTPLVEASRSGKVDIVKLLLKHGAAINSPDHEGRKALHWACFGGFESVAKALLGGGASISADFTGRTPLHDAAYHGSESIVKLLLDNGADPQAKFLAGTTLDSWSKYASQQKPTLTGGEAVKTTAQATIQECEGSDDEVVQVDKVVVSNASDIARERGWSAIVDLLAAAA